MPHDTQTSTKPRFFVSIAAFCDPWLCFTLKSLFESAHHPERIVVGVVDQSFDSQQAWVEQQAYADQICYLHVNPLHSRGVCWARHLAQTLFDDETYYLQIDSHTWLDPGWDTALEQQFEMLTRLSHKPILSIYPPPFEFDEQSQPFKKLRDIPRLGIFAFKNADTFTADQPLLKAKVAYQALPDQHYDYVARGGYIAGGFLLTLGRFVHEVPYDANFYFHGEEQALALRAFTHGWDIFHGRYDRVPLSHLYKQPKHVYASHHWRQDLEARRTVSFQQRRQSALQRLRSLIQGVLPEPYGLGSTRTLADYAELSGVDYRAGVVTETPTATIRVRA